MFMMTTKVYKEIPEEFSPKVEVAAIYVAVEGKLLLLQLSDDKSERGAWGVPAGKIEIGEQPLHGAKRELFEETSINISENSFTPLGTLYIRKPEIDYAYHLFGIDLNRLPDVHLSSEHCAYRWVSKEEAENLPLMKGAKPALEAYYQALNGGKR